MATAPKAKAAPANEAEAPPKKSKKLLFIIIGLVVVLAGGGGAAWFMTRGGGEHKEAEKEVSKPPVFLPLETFTVNLHSEGEDDRYLQVAMTLKVADLVQVDLFKLNMPEIRSRMLLLLSSKRPAELATPEGKQKLTDEIVATLSKKFSGQSETPEISGVFFTSFVIQ